MLTRQVALLIMASAAFAIGYFASANVAGSLYGKPQPLVASSFRTVPLAQVVPGASAKIKVRTRVTGDTGFVDAGHEPSSAAQVEPGSSISPARDGVDDPRARRLGENMLALSTRLECFGSASGPMVAFSSKSTGDTGHAASVRLNELEKAFTARSRLPLDPWREVQFEYAAAPSAKLRILGSDYAIRPAAEETAREYSATHGVSFDQVQAEVRDEALTVIRQYEVDRRRLLASAYDAAVEAIDGRAASAPSGGILVTRGSIILFTPGDDLELDDLIAACRGAMAAASSRLEERLR